MLRSPDPKDIRRTAPTSNFFDRDICPDTGLARLSVDQARDLLDAVTAIDGPGTGPGWDLHELRHSGLTHTTGDTRPHRTARPGS